MARKPEKHPDYFTPEEAAVLVAAAPSYEVRMAMRIMLRTGLRVSECLSLRPADLRLNLDPPILSLRPDVLGKKAKRGREVPVPADLVESLANLKSFHRRDRDRPRPLFDISRNWVSKSMKEEEAAGIDPAKDHPRALRHTYGRKAVLRRGADSRAPGLAGTPVPGGRPPLLVGGKALGNRDGPGATTRDSVRCRDPTASDLQRGGSALNRRSQGTRRVGQLRLATTGSIPSCY